MADSGGSSSPGPGSGSSGPWWKSLTSGSKKKGKDSGGAPGSERPQPPASAAPQPGPREPSPPGRDPSELPRLEGPAGEKASGSRRNLKISRSGRFKEKRKVRATLLPKPPDEPDCQCAPHDSKR